MRIVGLSGTIRVMASLTRRRLFGWTRSRVIIIAGCVFVAALTLMPPAAGAAGTGGPGWSVFSPAPASQAWAIAATSPSDIWLLGGGAEHWDGTRWGEYANTPPSGTLRAVAEVSASDAWAVGWQTAGGTEGVLIQHWNGSGWATVPAPDPGSNAFLYAVAARSTDDAWAVGSYYDGAARGGQGAYATLMEHWDGSSWTVAPSVNDFPDQELYAVAAIAADDAWAVGRITSGPGGAIVPLIEHWNGSAWSIVANPGTAGELNSIAAISANDVWVVGADVEHWDGVSWQIVPTPSPPGAVNTGLVSVAASATDDVWAVGSLGDSTGSYSLTEHWDGHTWTIVPSPNPTSPSGLTTVVALDSATAFAGGATLLRYGPGTFTSALQLNMVEHGTDGPNITVGSAVTFYATLTFSEGGRIWNEPVHFDRSNPDGSTTPLPDGMAAGNGPVMFTDTPAARGAYTYTVSWGGTGLRSGATASFLVHVNGLLSSLTLTGPESSVGSGHTVTLHAHLGAPTINRTVLLYGKPSGGVRTLVAQGQADAQGDITFAVAPDRNEDFQAESAGDALYVPATSGKISVFVPAVVTARLLGGYRTTGRYRLYHYRTTCGRRLHGCVLDAIKVRPNRAGACVTVDIDIQIGRQWQLLSRTNCVRLDSASSTLPGIGFTNRAIIGHRFRIIAAIMPDGINLYGASPWRYFKITN